EELYGYSVEQMRGQPPSELQEPVYAEQPNEIERKLLRDGSWTGIVGHTARDGRRLQVDSRRVLVTRADGRRVVLETNRDVTDRVEAERALRASEFRFRQLSEAV